MRNKNSKCFCSELESWIRLHYVLAQFYTAALFGEKSLITARYEITIFRERRANNVILRVETLETMFPAYSDLHSVQLLHRESRQQWQCATHQEGPGGQQGRDRHQGVPSLH